MNPKPFWQSRKLWAAIITGVAQALGVQYPEYREAVNNFSLSMVAYILGTAYEDAHTKKLPFSDTQAVAADTINTGSQT